MALGTLFWQKRIGMYLSKPVVSCICLQHGFSHGMDAGIPEQLEIVLLSVGKSQRNDLSSLKADKQLCL